MQFIDYVKIHVESGHGGPGCVSFRREKYVPRGGPDGGDGGRGGSIIFNATRDLNTLLDLRYQQQYKAKDGQHGMGQKMHGKDAKNLIIRVPVGTIVRDAATGELIADLDEEGKEAVAAKGGRGGLGNSHFATSVRQAPKFAQPGEEGEEKDLIVELKLLADVGLIGLPNAGKSTLISVISAARPKIADYPFTTLVPVLGVVKLPERKSFIVADIPGLIEGAHEGAGLGFQFLRHVERTRILIHLVDVSVMSVGDPVESLQKINRELALYSEELIGKPQAVAATKIDIKDDEKLKKLQKFCKKEGIDFFPVSSAAHKGLDKFLDYLSNRLAR